MKIYTEKDIKRFYSHVAVGKSTECWEWIGSRQQNGYGLFWFDYKMRLAHRFAFWFSTGIDPDDLCVCHSCDNSSCVNPAHLWLGTHYDNKQDSIAKGREAHGEMLPQAKLTEVEVIEIRRQHATGHYTCEELSKEYNVNAASIGNIINRKSWTHI